MIEHGDNIWSFVIRFWNIAFLPTQHKKLLRFCHNLWRHGQRAVVNTKHQLILYFCIFTLGVWAKTKTVVVCIGMCNYKYIINIASCNRNDVSLTLLSSPSNMEATNQNYFPLITVLLCMRNNTHYTMSSYMNFEQYKWCVCK